MLSVSTFLLYICSFSLLVGAVWKAEVIIRQEGIHEYMKLVMLHCTRQQHVALQVINYYKITDFENCNYIRGCKLFNKHEHRLERHCPLRALFKKSISWTGDKMSTSRPFK